MSKGRSQANADNSGVIKQLSFKEALLSPRPMERGLQGVHVEERPVEQTSLSAAAIDQRPRLCTMLVVPKRQGRLLPFEVKQDGQPPPSWQFREEQRRHIR
jgi:hypothetical protein